jgi:hypothetical protein
MKRSLLPLAFFAVGCASEYHPDYHPETANSFSQTINYGTLVTAGAASTSAPSPTGITARDPSRVLVLQGTHLDRPAEVIGVVDAHLKVGDQDAALAALRRRAADMGADAVVGVEFHHGEGPGEPIHLSGLAVRFLATLPLSGGGT